MEELRNELILKILSLPGIEERPSRLSSAKTPKSAAYFFKGREVAHFHHNHEIDLRLTRKLIRREGLQHPADSKIHQHRGSSSDWLEIRFQSRADVEEAVRLLRLALTQY